MRKSIFSIFVMLLTGLAPAGHFAVAAQPVAPVPVASTADEGAYAELYEAIESGLDQERILNQVIVAFSQQLATADPDLVKAEALFPGLSAALGEGVRPIFRSYRARLQLAYRPRMIAVMKEVLSEGEAYDAAELYRSPVGRKLMGGVSAGFDGKATVTSALHDKDVGDAAVRADVDVAVNRAVGGLASTDLAELERMARAKPGLLKLGQLGSKTMPLRVAMENEPLNPEEEAELERLMDAAADAHIAKFEN